MLPRMIENVRQHGAVGDGHALETAALQAALDTAARAGGGVVAVPPGRYRSGTLRLRSDVELHLAPGAVLVASADPADYPNADLQCLLEARGEDRVRLTGGGIIEGGGVALMAEDLRYIYRPPPGFRPRLAGFIGCRHLTIRDVTFRDAPVWTLHLVGCQDVWIDGIRILNSLKVPNCDGIDPDHCRDVRISNCHIEAGDDAIVIKNTAAFRDFGPTENILVENCTLVSTSAALKVGTESVDDFRGLIFRGCTIRRSSRGVSLQLRDQGSIEDVLVSDLVIETRLFEDHWWGKAEPVAVTCLRRFGDRANPADLPAWNPRNELGWIRGVRFRGLRCRSENGIFVAGSADRPISDLGFDDVTVTLDKWTKWPGGRQDRRPVDKLGPDFRDPAADPGLRDHPTHGFHFEHVHDLRLRDCMVRWGAERPDYFAGPVFAHAVTGQQGEVTGS